MPSLIIQMYYNKIKKTNCISIVSDNHLIIIIIYLNPTAMNQYMVKSMISKHDIIIAIQLLGIFY